MSKHTQYRQMLDEILEKGYTLNDIAKKLGLSKATLRRIYSGETESPRFSIASPLYYLHVYERPDLWGAGSEWEVSLSLKDKTKFYYESIDDSTGGLS